MTDPRDKVGITPAELYVALFQDGVFDDSLFRQNVGLIMDYTIWRDYLFLYEIYKLILEVPGDILEFGCRFGRSLTTFLAFRTTFEPVYFQRRIVGFDTFEGLKGVSDVDGNHPAAAEGAYATGLDWAVTLQSLLTSHETISFSSMPKDHKALIIKGDVTNTVSDYFNDYPATVVALAYFDLDIYAPTKEVLLQTIERMPKGSVIVFDQLNYNKFPGETIAAMEVLPPREYAYKRFPFCQAQSYVVL